MIKLLPHYILAFGASHRQIIKNVFFFWKFRYNSIEKTYQAISPVRQYLKYICVYKYNICEMGSKNKYRGLEESGFQAFAFITWVNIVWSWRIIQFSAVFIVDFRLRQSLRLDLLLWVQQCSFFFKDSRICFKYNEMIIKTYILYM